METENTVSLYSPLAILNLFNNSISVNQTKRIIKLKGVFIPRGSTAYGGYYYDSLRDESADALLTIIVPALIRNTLQENKTIIVNGFISRRVVNSASRIEVQFTVTDFVEETQNRYSEDDLQRVSLLQAKANVGFRDVQGWIKEKINREEHFKIGVIIGKSAIIDQDIKHQLRESIGFYDLFFHKISLSSEQEIINAMEVLDGQGIDVIVISRGGGENLEMFNKPSIAEKAITLKSLFITAIGHKSDVTLLQQVADKAFITPSEFGQFLNDTYNHTVEEIQNSKARLVETVTKQLNALYQKEIETLNEKVKGVQDLKNKSQADLEKLYKEQIDLVLKNHQDQIANATRLKEQELSLLTQQLEGYKNQLKSAEMKSGISWWALIAGVILGIIIGFLIYSFYRQ